MESRVQSKSLIIDLIARNSRQQYFPLVIIIMSYIPCKNTQVCSERVCTKLDSFQGVLAFFSIVNPVGQSNKYHSFLFFRIMRPKQFHLTAIPPIEVEKYDFCMNRGVNSLSRHPPPLLLISDLFCLDGLMEFMSRLQSLSCAEVYLSFFCFRALLLICGCRFDEII